MNEIKPGTPGYEFLAPDETEVESLSYGAVEEVRRHPASRAELALVATIDKLREDRDAARRERDEMAEERDVAQSDLSLLANDMVYQGNSVSYIYDKCEVRGHQLMSAVKALSILGYKAGGKDMHEYREHVRIWAEQRGASLDRTLTLPNGTVVRAGDVLARIEEDDLDFPADVAAVRVLVITTEGFTGKILAQGFEDEKVLETTPRLTAERYFQPGDRSRVEVTWKPWSEVYPDRPVPGGGE